MCQRALHVLQSIVSVPSGLEYQDHGGQTIASPHVGSHGPFRTVHAYSEQPLQCLQLQTEHISTRICSATIITLLAAGQVPEELVQHCLRRNGDDCDDPQQ